MPELESSRPSVTALNSIGIVGVCTIWDNKRVNGLLIYGKNIDCQLSPSVDSCYYYYIRVHLNGKKRQGFIRSKLVTLISVALKRLGKALGRCKSGYFL